MNDRTAFPRSSLILVGHSGAGKTTLAELLGKRTGLAVVEVGHIVIGEADRLGVVALDHADRLFQARQFLHFVQQVAGGHRCGRPLIIVGPRVFEEILYLKDVYGPSFVVALTAPVDLREARRVDLILPIDDNLSRLRQRDAVEDHWDLQRTIRSANLVLDSAQQPLVLAATVERAWRAFDER